MAGTFEVWNRGGDSYPSALLALSDPPDSIFAVGDRAVLDRQIIAVVGARRAMSRSLGFATRIAATLARSGACVVSGLAIGVDAAAHEGAIGIDAGRTCAVLGGGIDGGCPVANRDIRDRIADDGGLLLSEWGPGVKTERWMFPHRNRLIAALARAVIVVEASTTSGSLHTVRAAFELERPVGVVPGPVDMGYCRGSNGLLNQPGVVAIVEPEDALGFLSSRVETVPPRPELSDDEAAVWDVLANGAADVDTITQRSRLTTVRCLAAITALELAGNIECTMSGEVRRR